ncbi:CHRD domain-containing protein [Agromyces italicus]|uniref:CHRD domain-containing protein n=1 Tax=Agromyces italicus TaxID=279572 RepID=UPI0003B68EDE|nr:CHRD domain-containing protein [Agromyces italicus]
MRTPARIRIAALTAVAAAALTFAGAGAAQAKPPGTPAIPLNNEQESQTTGATGGARGFMAYEIVGDEFCYTVEVEGLTGGAVATHVHVAPRNVAGPVVIPIAVPNATSFVVEDCVAAAPALLAAIAAAPKAYYLNVHTPMFPGGEVRGQLK